MSDTPDTIENTELSTDERALIQHVREKNALRASRVMERIIGEPYSGGDAPYEDCIAAYIVGKLALQGFLPHGFIENMGGVDDMVRVVSESILEGVAAYGWRGSISELINYGDAGIPAGWKSIDLAGAK